MALGRGFSQATSESIESLVISLCGEEGQGKTHFSLTAPGDIAFFNTDLGLRGVVEKFADEKKIHVFNVSVPSVERDGDLANNAARDEWDRMMVGVKAALNTDSIRTLVFDTATEIWELLRLAHFGKLTEVQSWHYGPCNAEYRNLIKLFFDREDNPIKNVILLHKMKTIYANNKATDRREAAGFSGTGHMVQVNATMTKDTPWEDADGNWNTGDYNFQYNLRKGCRMQPDLDGTYLVGDDSNFPEMAMQVLPDADPLVWL